MSERRDMAVFTKFYQDEFVNVKSIGLQTSESCNVSISVINSLR